MNSAQTKKNKILFIGDNSELILAKEFPSEYEIFPAASADAAVELLRTHSPDIILIDLATAGNGIELYRQIKSKPQSSNTPVILAADKDSELNFSKASADAVILKPFNSPGLIAGLIEMLRVGNSSGEHKSGERFLSESGPDEKSENTLRANSGRLSSVLMTAIDGFWIVDENGFIADVNEAACSMLGYKRGEILNLKITDIFAEKSESKIHGKMAEIISAGSDKFETKHIRRDRSKIIVEISLTWHPEDRLFYGFIRDITEAKKTQSALLESEYRFRSLFENSTIGVYRTTPEGRIIMANPALVKMLGFDSFEELSSRNLEEVGFEPAYSRKKFREKLESEGEIKGLEAVWHRFDGAEIYVRENAKVFKDESGAALYYEGTVEDVSLRKETEQEIIRKNQLITAILEYAPIGFAVNRISTGKIEYVGSRFEEIYGVPKNSLKGVDTFFEDVYTDPEFREKMKERILADLMSGDLSRMHWENIPLSTRNGKHKFISAMNIPVFDQDLMVSVVRDVTEQHLNEIALLESEKSLREAQRIASVGSWENDLAGNALVWSDEMYRIMGLPHGVPVKLADAEKLFPPEELKRLRNAITNAILHNSVYSEDYKIIKPDGEIRFIHDEGEVLRDENGKAVKFRGITQDITGRKMTEEILAESELRFRSVWESSKDGMRLTDKDGITTMVNEAYCRLVGFHKEDLVGQPFSAIYFPEQSRKSLDSYRERYRLNRFDDYYEREFILQNGVKKWFAVSNSKIEFERDNAVILSIFRDISDKKLTEKVLGQYREELEQLVEARTLELKKANVRLLGEIQKKNEYELILKDSLEKEKEAGELKDKFISNTSHEFRTPLTAILSSVELLRRFDEKWPHDKKEHFFEKIINSIDHLISLLDEVLTLSRADSGKLNFSPADTDIEKMIGNLLHEIEPVKKPEHTFEYNSQLKRGTYFIDEKLLRSVLTNLLTNAFKYSPDGGKVRFNVNEKNGSLHFMVADEGIGIPEPDQKFLFEPFFRSSNTIDIQGSGLGLSIVYKAVNIHNGKIDFHSEPGRGSVFTVIIPEGERV